MCRCVIVIRADVRTIATEVHINIKTPPHPLILTCSRMDSFCHWATRGHFILTWRQVLLSWLLRNSCADSSTASFESLNKTLILTVPPCCHVACVHRDPLTITAGLAVVWHHVSMRLLFGSPQMPFRILHWRSSHDFFLKKLTLDVFLRHLLPTVVAMHNLWSWAEGLYGWFFVHHPRHQRIRCYCSPASLACSSIMQSQRCSQSTTHTIPLRISDLWRVKSVIDVMWSRLQPLASQQLSDFLSRRDNKTPTLLVGIRCCCPARQHPTHYTRKLFWQSAPCPRHTR